MPRRRLPPRLYLDKGRHQWAILDGADFIRTGCAHDELAKAERVLAEYIGQKYQPVPSPTPPVADILLAYLRDKVPHMKARSAKYNIANLATWWSDKTLAEVTAINCRSYANTKTQSAARADLEKLAAALQHWHKEYGPLDKVPVVWKPPRVKGRDRWLTRSQAARFLWETRRTEHLKRFVMIGLYTGSRSGVMAIFNGPGWTWNVAPCGGEPQAPARQRTSARHQYLSRASSYTSCGVGTALTPATPSTSSITTARRSSVTFKRHGGTQRSVLACPGCIRISCGIRGLPGWFKRVWHRGRRLDISA
jgi:hypothetical protein